MATHGRRVFVVKPVSIIKIVGSAAFFIAAGSAALVFAVAPVPNGEKLAADAITATTSAPQPASVTETPAAGPAAQVQTALAAIKANPAAPAAELTRAPEGDGKDQALPSFDIARVESGGDAVIAGRAAPGSTVDLLRDGRRLDQVLADASGQFVIISPRLPAGSYELMLSAKSSDGTVVLSKRGVLVTVNDAGPSARLALPGADDLTETASKPRLSSEPHLRTGKPQENASLQSTHSIPASSASDESASSPAVAQEKSSRVVSRGDSLWRISRVTYGDGARYAFVYRANRDRIRDPNLIYPGQTLLLPLKRK